MSDIDRAKALFFQGLDYLDGGNFKAAEESFRATLAIMPQHVPSLTNLAVVLHKQNRIEESASAAETALASDNTNIEAYVVLANCRKEQKRYDEGLIIVRKISALEPQNAAAFANQSFFLNQSGKFEDAIASADRALEIEPGYAEAHINRGNALFSLKRYQDALEAYNRALSIRPDEEFLRGYCFAARKAICDWQNHDQIVSDIVMRIGRGENVIDPFFGLNLSGSPDLHRTITMLYVDAKYPAIRTFPSIKYGDHAKIRIGYFSADFHNHATAFLIAELIEQHDRSKFEIIGFSFGPGDTDVMRERLCNGFDRFIDVRHLSDEDAALLARHHEIDIAIDLKGFTEHARTGIFAARAAPIQVNYLGYPGTMAADYIDYMIADRVVISAEQRRFNTEKIAYLPNSYQVNDTRRAISQVPVRRAAHGLAENGFVFCCFNNNYKITPQVFDDWMTILKRVERSVLWLFEDNVDVARNLRLEAEARGVTQDRLVFAQRAPLPEHLARHRLADLFLDTLPYNAHTTASDALWTGLPVLTRQGEAFAGRVAASLLHAIGLPELITTTREDYVALAVELATHPHKLDEIKGKLDANRLTTPLFDIKSFTAHIETLYARMYDRHRRGLPPEDIDTA